MLQLSSKSARLKRAVSALVAVLLPALGFANEQAKEGDGVIHYLGTGGVLIEYEGEAVIADPFFSNPSLADLVLLRDLKPKVDTIKKYLPNTDNVKGLLIGHGHYDHLMDVPVVAGLIPESAKVYGSDTALNQIASAVSEDRRVSVTEMVRQQGGHQKQWLQLSPGIRIMPLLAEHAPHVGGYLLANGVVNEPLQHLPGDVMDWQCGETIGYVLEWLDGQKVEFRALYLSSSSGYPKGVPPESYLQQVTDASGRVDVALLSSANFQAVDNYPEGVLAAINPKAVVVLHWERFWQPYEPGKEQAIKDDEVSDFVAAIEQSAPTAAFYVPRRLEIIPLSVEVGQ